MMSVVDMTVLRQPLKDQGFGHEPAPLRLVVLYSDTAPTVNSLCPSLQVQGKVPTAARNA